MSVYRLCWWSTLCLLATAVGCGPTNISVQGNEEQVQQAVRQVLEAWKSGQDCSAYTQAGSKVVVADEDWQAGAKLKNFQLLEAPKPNGSHWRQKVELELVNKSKTKPTVIYYAVTLGEPVSILRSDFSH